jgi:DNA-binding transcriptional regulator LsrR (DeoR family)
VLAARAALSYAAVMHHGLSFTAVAQHVGLSRRSISRAITRAQVCGLTDIIPKAATAPPTTPP